MSNTVLSLGVVGVYLLLLAAIGFWSYRHSGRDPVSYFLAGRGLGSLALTLTTLATLLSAFTFIGVPADAYTHGLGIFLGVGVTTALISGLFLWVGYRVWLAAQHFGFITPSEFFGHRFNSPLLALLYCLSALMFTAPYISIQIIGGARTLAAVLGEGIPYWPLAVVVALVILGYVLFGGSQAVVWTDVVQGIILILGMGVAFVAVAFSLGREAGSELDPWLSLPGPQGRWSWQGLLGNQLLFFMATPLFPQFFQRFYMARSAHPFKTLMVVWPLLILLVFFPAALLGVWGRLAFPGLEKADQIMPLMLQTLPGGVAAVVITAALAALMSTADSQLLTASSLVTRDLVVTLFRRQLSPHQEEQLGRWVVLGIGLASFAIALNPPGLIVEIATWSFQGNAMLFPILIAGLYWKRATRAGAVAGALVSSGLTLGWLSGLLPRAWTGGWLPVIPAVVIGSGVLIGVSLLTQPPKEQVTAYYEEGPWGE
ncbi:sodium:solute symporter family protein [Synechococcus sp. JA-2-3B'a(2-13)]|uniref:sodium:solute symporter family protein n=1 Tax=Synechococcus sp. (strain JA-2-3B'a(2-13)) TaxID=321332 RepID=UPI0000694BF7|nr:sodium:solute symporter family protein [Synechococcus sp. JA-2-3B'a(2-13)]ABD01666.1 transporter, solute:sodium symporter (SSS) family [Synechococcus sp. JA-2-3B'a(2-13)]